MELKVALDNVQHTIHTALKCTSDVECKVYTYSLDPTTLDNTGRILVNRPWVGIRVSEVSVHNERGGAAYMQCDLGGLLVCAAVERVLLALLEDWEPVEIDEERWRLEEALKSNVEIVKG